MQKIILITIFSLATFAQVAAPTLNETERLKMENLALRRQNLELQAQAIRDAQAKLEGEINAFLESVKIVHPGYQLGANGQLEKLPEVKK